MNEVFDFGFTAVDEAELEIVQQAQQELSKSDTESAELQQRLDKLFNSVQPLLANLKANPEKEYIYWPKRTDKIEQFETVIYNIYKGV